MASESFIAAQKLIGKSAGKLCFSNLAPGYYTQIVIASAEIVWESYRSAWTLSELWEDGTTVWLSPDEDQVATVGKDGKLYIAENPIL